MPLTNIEKEELTEDNLLNCINKYLESYEYKLVGLNNVIYNTGIDSLDYMELNLILTEKFKEIDYNIMYKLNMSKCKVIDIYNCAKGIK